MRPEISGCNSNLKEGEREISHVLAAPIRNRLVGERGPAAHAATVLRGLTASTAGYNSLSGTERPFGCTIRQWNRCSARG